MEVFTQGYYSLSFLFLSSLGCLQRGFQPNDGTQAPHRGFHLSPYFFIFYFSQLVGGVEIDTYSTTNIVLFRSSMNFYLERGFL